MYLNASYETTNSFGCCDISSPSLTLSSTINIKLNTIMEFMTTVLCHDTKLEPRQEETLPSSMHNHRASCSMVLKPSQSSLPLSKLTDKNACTVVTVAIRIYSSPFYQSSLKIQFQITRTVSLLQIRSPLKNFLELLQLQIHVSHAG